ncbi:MAG: hypothetical protein CW691_11725 [Candidatus Bathyarchaeum sp.]|nr:MAG: hypothetical protein CW691_11725 [Candidatus Bathyarchaeum sp.]
MNVANNFKKMYIVGATLLIISLIIWLVPTVFLGSIEGRMDHLSLRNYLTETEAKMSQDLQWSHIWWETQQTTIFNPVATVLLAIGLIIIIYGVITKFGW